MKWGKSLFRVVVPFVAVAAMVALPQAQAQTITTVGFQRIGPSQYVAVPTVRVLRPNYARASAMLNSLSLTREYWTVGLRTSNGVVTRTYRVNDSRQAMQRAKADFPGASFIGVRKAYN